MKNVPIFCDCDGVLGDFYNFAEVHLGRPYKSMDPVKAWKILERIPHLYALIPVLPDAHELWAGISKYPNHALLTAGPRPTHELRFAARDKRAFFRKNFSATAPMLLSKSGVGKALFASPGAVLIDDLSKNINAWEAAGGKGILHVDAKTSLAQLDAYMLETG